MRNPLVLPTLGLLLAAVGVAACGRAEEPPVGRLPEPLRVLRLVEDHPQIPAAVFPHAAHTERGDPDRRVACAQCHHELQNAPAAVPQACRACHVYAYLAPEKDEVDESEPHDHPPPDL